MTYREGEVKKAVPTGVAEGGVNHNEAMCAAFLALADVHDAKGDCPMIESGIDRCP